MSATTKPKSTHTSSPLLAPFLGATFDPTAYLNSHLAPLGIPTPSHPILPSGSLSISEHAARTQPQLASLAALANQLASTLTELTDDVLRSGARLAYAVELLRGEARALREALREGLRDDIAGFVPGGLEKALERLEVDLGADGDGEAEEEGEGGAIADVKSEDDGEDEAKDSKSKPSQTKPAAHAQPSSVPIAETEPPALFKLRTLHRVRSRLQEVITIFDSAMAWPLPPSAQNTGGGFVSVAPPTDPKEAEEAKQREERGQAAQNAIKERVATVLAVKGPEGLRKAEDVLEELRELCEVWKGTTEDKPRVRFVESLAKVVAERRREEEEKATIRPGSSGGEKGRAAHPGPASGRREERGGASGGWMGGLRRLKEEIYLE